MEVAAEKRRAADPVGEAKRQRELTEMRVEKRKREKEEADAGEMEEEEEAPSKHLSMTLEQAEALKKKQDKTHSAGTKHPCLCCTRAGFPTVFQRTCWQKRKMRESS